METINNVELRDPDIYPDEDVLKSVLLDSYESYLELLKLYSENGLTPEWRYYNDGKAWLCKVQLKKKTIVWMSAWKGYMQAAMYIPVRLLDDILSLDIANETKERIKSTKDVGKSKPCIFDVHDSSVMKDLETVMHFKIKSK